MTAPSEIEILRSRLKGFLMYLKPKMLLDGANMVRLDKLRRMSDVRIRRFSVGRSTVNGTDLCGALREGEGPRFDELAVKTAILLAPQMKEPIPMLGEEMGYIVEAGLCLNVIGAEKMESHASAWVAKEGPVVRPETSKPAEDASPSTPAAAPLPEPVARVLGNAKDLWAMDGKTRELQATLADSSTPVDQATLLIDKDPDLRARCLQIINSIYYAERKDIGSIKRAMVTLGYPTIRLIATIASLVIHLEGKKPVSPFDPKAFWEHSLQVAHGAALVVKTTLTGQPEDYFCTGLVHDIGKLVESTYLGNKQAPGDLHALIGSCVCERWDFPPAVVAAVRHHLDPGGALAKADVPKEALVIAAVCDAVRRDLSPEETATWSGLTRLPAGKFPGIRKEASTLAAGSLRDIFDIS